MHTTNVRRDADNEQDWFAQAFGPLYPMLYAHRSLETAAPEAEFARGQLGLAPGSAVLDLCCGTGRHMFHLAKHCPNLTGLDYSSFLLHTARKTLGKNVRLVRADMRRLPFSESFDAVLNFFTSFGYFASDAENAAVFTEIARVLRPQGRFFLDYMNAPHVRNTLIPLTERRQHDFLIEERRWIDPRENRVNKSIRVLHNGVIHHEGRESVRLYDPPELLAMMRSQGLEPAAVFGNYDASPLTDEQPRMIVTGYRMSHAQSL